MNQGVIVQEGSAETLYHRPASEFVAQFIGRTNLLKGKVMSVSSGKVDLDIQGWRLEVATERADFVPGASIQVMVRPEAIELRPLSAGDSLKGTILSRVFLGEKVEYQVSTGSEVLEVADYRRTHTGGLIPGDEVSIGFATDRVQLLPGGTP
jgi:ABC-type Fe3+/spermidine/putrescine transport system ATPase subunit